MAATLKLMEETRGVGRLEAGDAASADVEYEFSRYQGMAASGMPIPGLHRIEGRVVLTPADAEALGIGTALTLKLDDGRALRVTLADADGRILAEGHGPTGCQCC